MMIGRTSGQLRLRDRVDCSLVCIAGANVRLQVLRACIVLFLAEVVFQKVLHRNGEPRENKSNGWS